MSFKQRLKSSYTMTRFEFSWEMIPESQKRFFYMLLPQSLYLITWLLSYQIVLRKENGFKLWDGYQSYWTIIIIVPEVPLFIKKKNTTEKEISAAVCKKNKTQRQAGCWMINAHW